MGGSGRLRVIEGALIQVGALRGITAFHRAMGSVQGHPQLGAGPLRVGCGAVLVPIPVGVSGATQPDGVGYLGCLTVGAWPDGSSVFRCADAGPLRPDVLQLRAISVLVIGPSGASAGGALVPS